MKNKLYWRIFLWFWLAMLLTMLIVLFFSNYVVRQHYVPLKNNALISAYTVATEEIYQYAGRQGVVNLYQQVYRDSGAELYLINEHGQSVLTYRFPDTSDFILNLLEEDLPPQAFFKKGAWLLGPVIQTLDGGQYRILAKLPPPTSVFQKKDVYIWVVRLLIAITIIGILCYMLSVYVTKPIRQLKNAAAEIRKGNLSVRVADAILPRGDEIADLALEFDRMVIQLENLSAVQTKMLHDVSHELRSPLARLQVALELAQRRSESNLEKEFNRIRLECERLNQLISEILSWSRLQSLTEIQPQDVDILQLIKQIIDDANYEFANCQTHAILKTTFNQIIIQGDEWLLRCAIENILRNALRYTPEKTAVELHIWENSVAQQLYISIRDFGPGVPVTELDNIFMPFYRLTSMEKNNVTGYGLGLAIAAQAIKLHHGRITARNLSSESGGGLEVSICLPMKLNVL